MVAKKPKSCALPPVTVADQLYPSLPTKYNLPPALKPLSRKPGSAQRHSNRACRARNLTEITPVERPVGALAHVRRAG